jgi:hypothetical protein
MPTENQPTDPFGPNDRTFHILALAQGKEVLPFGLPCEGFDFTDGECP